MPSNANGPSDPNGPSDLNGPSDPRRQSDPHWQVDQHYRPVAEAFAAQLEADPDYSAQVCAFVDGRKVIDLWGGPALGEHSIVTVFSSSKGVSGICIALLIQRGLLDPDTAVSRYWPEFASAGKGEITVRQLLSHQAGLPEIDGGLTFEELFDDALGAVKLAAQRPLWHPGSTFGYHAITLGILMSELCRRVTGMSIQRFYETEIRAPRGFDMYLGLPESEEARVSDILFPQAAAPHAPAPTTDETPTDPGQLANLVAAPLSLDGAQRIANSRESHAAGMPAASGVGSARGLAGLYAATVTDVGGPRLLTDETIAIVGQVQAAGFDLIVGAPGCYGIVFQKPHPGRPFAGYRAFGHDGAAGAFGFADPQLGLGFGYVTNRPAPAGGELRADELAAVIRRCALS